MGIIIYLSINFSSSSLLRADIMEELVTLITTEPTTDLPEKERYKQAHIACELLTSDMPVFNERLASDQIILSKLYAFLQNEHPLNPLLASFFSRTLGVLIARTSEQVSLQQLLHKVLELNFKINDIEKEKKKAKYNFINDGMYFNLCFSIGIRINTVVFRLLSFSSHSRIVLISS